MDAPTPNRADSRAQLLLLEPRRALIQLAGPSAASTAVVMIYWVTAAVWVAGLGSEALSAIGFVAPAWGLIMGGVAGLSAGAGTCVSRALGTGDRAAASRAAINAIAVGLGVSACLTLLLVGTARWSLELLGAGAVTEPALRFAYVLFGGCTPLVMAQMLAAMLRAEGDATRAMFAMMLGFGLNMVFDPLFIFVFDMGLAGAAWAAIASALLANALILYWLLRKRDTYVEIRWSAKALDWKLMQEILKQGLAIGLFEVVAGALIVVLTLMLARLGGTESIAVFSAGSRLVQLMLLPVLALGTALMVVVGANIGAGNRSNVFDVYRHALKLAAVASLVLSVAMFAFARQLAWLFTWGADSEHLVPEFALYFQVTAAFPLATSAWATVASLFTGLGMGAKVLQLGITRSFLFTVPAALLAGWVFDLGPAGVWAAVVVGSAATSVQALIAARNLVRSAG
jgi:putative MATE family efflux protein